MKISKKLFSVSVLVNTLLAILLVVLIPSHQTLAETDASLGAIDIFNQKIITSSKTDKILDQTQPDDYQKIDPERLESFVINIPQLDNRQRTINVYLPTDYKQSERSYPVVYLLNVQDLLIKNGNTNEWYINQSRYDFYTNDLGNDVIIIHIEVDQVHMWDEFSPWTNENMYHWIDPFDGNRIEGGEGIGYLDFIVDTLKMEIDKRYRTLKDHENTFISGYKMGGLLAIYAGLTRSDVFSRVTALSPAIWFAENGVTWMSNNRLIELTNKFEIPKNVKFRFEIAKEDQTSESIVKPFVYDSLGKRISFPQAYHEGIKALGKAFINQGLPIENIEVPSDVSIGLYEESSQSIKSDRDLIHKIHFPLVFAPEIPPQITSNNEASFYTDQTNSFLIVATGSPIPSLSIENLPKDIGVEFVDNGNGTASLSGKPNVQDAKILDLTIRAQNGVEPAASQQFSLRIADPAALKCPDAGSCIVNFNMDMTPYLNRARKVWVYLPPNYNESGESYQVIYLADEQHFFGDQSGEILDPKLDWKFDEKLDNLYERTGKGLIAVALEFDADHPWDEFTPWVNNNMDNWTHDTVIVKGVGDKILDFIVMKLKPTVDVRYRTIPDRESTAIGGGSRCGLFSIYAGLTKPETFSKVMAMSPAVWIAEGGPVEPLYNYKPYWLTTNQLLVWFNNNQAPTNVHHYLYVGEKEGGSGGGFPFVYRSDGQTQITWEQAYLEGANKVKQKLDVSGINYYYRVNPDGTHLPIVWKDYIEEALIWFGFYQ